MDIRYSDKNVVSHRGTEFNAVLVASSKEILNAVKDQKVVAIDEAQFLSADQVWELARAVDDLKVPVMCYGLRVDFQGKLFPGSAALLALADEMREIRTICHCGKKATMVVRQDEHGNVLKDGAQVQVGGNETYVSLCRVHWRQAIKD